MAEKGASIELKFEVVSLLDEIRDKSRERAFMEEGCQDVSNEVISELFKSCPVDEDHEQLKILYTEFISEYKNRYMPFGGKRGLISQLPEDNFGESEKNYLNNLYGLLSKYSHLSSYVLDFFLDDPSQVFTPWLNDKLFDTCIHLLTSVMDVFVATVYLHFSRLEVTEWLSQSVKSMQMPLAQKMIEKRKINNLS